jgi:hypothetical protein
MVEYLAPAENFSAKKFATFAGGGFSGEQALTEHHPTKQRQRAQYVLFVELATPEMYKSTASEDKPQAAAIPR